MQLAGGIKLFNSTSIRSHNGSICFRSKRPDNYTGMLTAARTLSRFALTNVRQIWVSRKIPFLPDRTWLHAVSSRVRPRFNKHSPIHRMHGETPRMEDNAKYVYNCIAFPEQLNIASAKFRRQLRPRKGCTSCCNTTQLDCTIIANSRFPRISICLKPIFCLWSAGLCRP